MSSDGKLFWLRASHLLDDLRRGARVTAPSFAQKLGISTPTVHRLLSSLRDDFRAPIRFDGKVGSWVLDDPSFDLPRLPLSTDEIAAIALARSLFERVSTPLLARAIESFWRKLDGELFDRSPEGSALARSVTAALPALSKVPASTLDAVLRALSLRRCLHVVYRSPWNEARSDRVVEPLRLVLYDGTYYLIGHCRLRGALRSFNLAAIERVELGRDRSREPDERTVERYLESGWGAFRGPGVVTAVIRVEPPDSRLLATQIWHPQQHDRVSKEGVLVRRLPVAGLPELTRRVLSLGASATVLDPPELREGVEREIRRMAARLGRTKAGRPSAGPGPRGRRDGGETVKPKKWGG